jgi:exodeoxyribonuclease V beta subunit
MTESMTHEVQPFEYWATPVAPGRTLVEASAGTGKTFAIAGLVLRLVLDGDWLAARPGGPPDLRRLLVVTFTRAATEELKTRIRAALRAALRASRGEDVPEKLLPLVAPLAELLARPGAEDRLLSALDRVDEAGVFTIHGFCKRVLEQAAFESGTPFEAEFVEDGDGSALRHRAAADAWARIAHADPLLAALAVRRKWTADALAEHHKATAEFPGISILPETPPLADCLGALRVHIEALRHAWDPGEIAELLAGLAWTKKACFTPDSDAERIAAIARVAAFPDDPDAVETVLAFAPAGLDDALHKSNKVNKERRAAIDAHRGIRACGAVADALATLGHSLARSFIDEVATRITAIKERRGLLTAGDLIRRLHASLHAPDTGPGLAEGIRGQFAVALIDEFQDTDPLQYAIFRTAFDGQPLYFVGDPKQAIYGFRGADVHAYLRAQAEADRPFTLGTNWRSTAGLVDAVNAVFHVPRRPFLFDGIPFRPVAWSPANETCRLCGDDKPPLVWWRVPAVEGKRPNKGDAAAELVDAVVCEIRRLLAGDMTIGGRPLAAGDIAVLVPNRYDAQDVLKALHKAGVPAVYSGTSDIRESAEMAEAELLLHAIAVPTDERALRAALATELWGWSATRVATLDSDDAQLDELRHRLRDWQRAWRRHGVLHVLARFQQEEGVADRLLSFADGERRMTNLRHTVELLHEIEAAADRSPEDLLHWLRHRHDQTLASRDRVELRLERDDEAVQITTHHSAKGLEYEVVFLPFLWATSQRETKKQATVLARTDEGVRYDLGSPESDRLERLRQADSLAEHVRKVYVAMTRARERCYVAWGGVNTSEFSGLAYLLTAHDADGDDLAAHVESARHKAKSCDPLAPLTALAEQFPELMVVEPLPCEMPASRPVDTAEAVPELRVRALPEDAHRRVQTPWRPASFTSWAAGGSTEVEHATTDEPEPAVRPAETVETGIHAFPRGTTAGNCLHEILEHADLSRPEDEDFEERNRVDVHKTLAKYGLLKPRRRRPLVDSEAEALALVKRVATTPMLGGEPLSACDRRALSMEWRFVFPLGRVAPAALADAFRAHAAPPFGGAYADALAALSNHAVDGFLAGTADLVAYHGERWWIVDWKSNHLGPDAEAYDAGALARAMVDHHYGLQLHLYAVGLHRYLRARLGARYDYDRDMGEAIYVFLRGLGDEGAGLFCHRPPRALIDALDALLGSDA